MINVSKEFWEEMRTRTDFKPAASIKLSDGTVLNVDSSDFTLSNNSLVDGAGESSIPLGVAIQKNIQIELVNDDDKYSGYDFVLAEITLFLEFELSASVESIQYGKYTVVSPFTRGSTVIITAVDDMYMADVPYDTKLAFPATIGEMLRDSCSATGISLYSSEFSNNDFVVAEKPKGFTHRQVIGFIAMIAGGNARINRSGYLEILTYDFWMNEKVWDGGNFQEWTSENTIDGGTFDPWTTGRDVSSEEFSESKKYHVLYKWLNDPKIDTDDILITGLQTTYTKENEEKTLLIGLDNYVLSIENPLIAGKEQDVLQYLLTKLLGLRFRQFTGDHVSYPLAEFMDAVIVVDRKGNIYNSFITDVDFSFLGMTIFKNSATPVLSNKRSYSSSKVEVLRQAKQMIAYEKSEREKAIEKLNETLANSSGMYVTEERQPDNSVIYYAHNKPTLSESDIVWKYTSEAIAVSTDGGKTYSYGFTVTGDMITRILSTEGISASWINSGTLKLGGAQNKDGKVDVYNSSGELIGYIKNTGIGFNSKDSDGYAREAILKNGGLYFTKEGSITGLIRRVAWGNDYDNSEGIMFGTHSKYIAIGYYGSGYGAGYILNNGLNPDGHKERNIFYGLTRFTGNIYADYRIAFSNGAYFNKGLVGENQAIFLKGSGFYVDGNISCGGSKNRVVDTENYGKRALNAFETAEPYFSDIGSGVIDDSGKAVIEFEDIFSETIERDIPYQVFITPTSELDCRCIKKERGKFTMSGDPGATFDYMICAKQKGYANVRLERMNMDE